MYRIWAQGRNDCKQVVVVVVVAAAAVAAAAGSVAVRATAMRDGDGRRATVAAAVYVVQNKNKLVKTIKKNNTYGLRGAMPLSPSLSSLLRLLLPLPLRVLLLYGQRRCAMGNGRRARLVVVAVFGGR